MGSQEVVVIGGSNSEHIAIRVSRITGVDYGFVYKRFFPDGELYVRIECDVSGRSVVYINSLQPSVNSSIIETLYTLYTLRELGARKLYAIVPYMAYARQDERFKPGEVVSIRVLAELFKTIDLDGLYTFDMHLHRISDPRELFGSRFYNLSAVKAIAEYLVGRNLVSRDTVVVGPDEEAEQWASRLAEYLGGVEYTVLEKERISDEEVRVTTKTGVSLAGKRVVIVDDIISTGGTMVETINLLKKLGAKEIIVTCIHPVLAGNALYKIMRTNPLDIVCTDTILSPVSKVSIAPLVRDYVLKAIMGTR